MHNAPFKMLATLSAALLNPRIGFPTPLLLNPLFDLKLFLVPWLIWWHFLPYKCCGMLSNSGASFVLQLWASTIWCTLSIGLSTSRNNSWSPLSTRNILFFATFGPRLAILQTLQSLLRHPALLAHHHQILPRLHLQRLLIFLPTANQLLLDDLLKI